MAKDRSKPERKEHEGMMKGLKQKLYKDPNPAIKVRTKANLKALKKLKSGA